MSKILFTPAFKIIQFEHILGLIENHEKWIWKMLFDLHYHSTSSGFTFAFAFRVYLLPFSVNKPWCPFTLSYFESESEHLWCLPSVSMKATLDCLRTHLLAISLSHSNSFSVNTPLRGGPARNRCCTLTFIADVAVVVIRRVVFTYPPVAHR